MMSFLKRTTVEPEESFIDGRRRRITEAEAKAMRPFEKKRDALLARRPEIEHKAEEASRREEAAMNVAGEAVASGSTPDREPVRQARQHREDAEADVSVIDQLIAQADDDLTQAGVTAHVQTAKLLRDDLLPALRDLSAALAHVTAMNRRVVEIELLARELISDRVEREQVVPPGLFLRELVGNETGGSRLSNWRSFVAQAGIDLGG